MTAYSAQAFSESVKADLFFVMFLFENRKHKTVSFSSCEKQQNEVWYIHQCWLYADASKNSGIVQQKTTGMILQKKKKKSSIP